MTSTSASDPFESAPAGEGSKLPNVQDYLRVLLRFKWGILVLTLAVGMISLLRASSETPIYQATATLLIERNAARFVAIQDVYQTSQMWDFGEYYQTQYEILRSRPVAERLVDSIGLDAFDAQPVKDAGFSLRRLWPWGAKAAPTAKPSDEERRNAAIATVLGGLGVVPVRNSQLVRLQMKHRDPKFAAVLANAHARAYIEAMMEGRLEMSQTASNWLGERTTALRAKLEQSEKALQEFRDRERLIDLKGVDSLASSDLTLASGQLSEVRRERAAKEARYREVERARAAGALATLPDLLADPLVSQLKQGLVAAERSAREFASRYGPKHPKRIEADAVLATARTALDQQLQIAAAAVERDYQAARLRESEVAAELGQAKGEVRDINRKQYELGALQRDVDANRQLYDLFQARFKETAAASGVQTANARLVETALPNPAPVYPNQQRALMIGLLLGLALGIALALVLDHMDNTLKGADDVEQRLGVPVLGLVPRLPSSEAASDAPIGYFGSHPHSSFAESVRTIRTAVLLSSVDQAHKRLLVTSSVPSEGKTTLSMNLAFSLGQMKKVLLIDADMRRPALHKGLPGQSQSPGLSEYVTGEAKISDCLRKIDGANVYVMPSGLAPPNPLEILSSRKFIEVLDSLGNTFDHVIIDCAPACAVSDALVLSKLVHGVIYVIRSDATQWQVAQNGLKRLARINAPLIGAVVNQVVPRKSGAGYGKYY
ncbi:MAG: GumC family protein, partial [Lysobacterales bacterium]